LKIQTIKTKDELRHALLRIDEIWGVEKGTTDGDELNVLITLVSDFEDSLILKERENQCETKINIDDL